MMHAVPCCSPLFLVGASCTTAAVCLMLAYARLPALYPLSLVAGFAFGSHWALMPSMASELFGLQHFATNYTLLQVGGPAMAGLMPLVMWACFCHLLVHEFWALLFLFKSVQILSGCEQASPGGRGAPPRPSVHAGFEAIALT
jgi:hypothetical protein